MKPRKNSGNWAGNDLDDVFAENEFGGGDQNMPDEFAEEGIMDADQAMNTGGGGVEFDMADDNFESSGDEDAKNFLK
jgi:hypothetical protein